MTALRSATAQHHLWLARHAQPLVDEGICYGRLDLPADPAASRKAALALQHAHPAPWALVRHSPLQRCELLSHDLRALQPDWAFACDDRLTEIDFGDWEGRPWASVPRADIDAWTADFARHRPGGGEALAAMLTRVNHALHDAGAAARSQGGDVLWITHAGVARCVAWLLAHGTRLPLSHEWTAAAPAYGDWIVLPLPGEDG